VAALFFRHAGARIGGEPAPENHEVVKLNFLIQPLTKGEIP
jgi:hypothetical protein